MKSLIVTLAVLPALGLAACGETGPRTAAKGICTPFVSTTAQGVGGPAASPGADPSAPVDDCLHRWAYSLARSSDPADVVGRATVAACSAALTRWNQQGLGQPGAETAGEPLSLVDGQPTNPFAAHHEFAQDRALFYVVQARAGHCAPPPPPDKGAPAPG